MESSHKTRPVKIPAQVPQSGTGQRLGSKEMRRSSGVRSRPFPHFTVSRSRLTWRPDPGSSRFGTEVSLGRVAQRHRKGLGLVEGLVVL